MPSLLSPFDGEKVPEGRMRGGATQQEYSSWPTSSRSKPEYSSQRLKVGAAPHLPAGIFSR